MESVNVVDFNLFQVYISLIKFVILFLGGLALFKVGVGGISALFKTVCGVSGAHPTPN